MSRNSLFAVLATLAITGCAAGGGMPSAPVQPPLGFWYTDYRAPLTVDLDGSELGTRVGEAKTTFLRIPFYFDLSFAWGDASLASAARQGNISQVRHADYRLMSVLGIYSELTTVAYGE